MHLLDMQSFNSTIFNVPRLFIALRYNLVSPHPHVQPVPRAEITADDANCGTVVPSQGFLSLREVWRHTEVGYVRNRTLEGQR